MIHKRRKNELEAPLDTSPMEKGDTLALLIAALTVMLPVVLLAVGLVALLIVLLF